FINPEVDWSAINIANPTPATIQMLPFLKCLIIRKRKKTYKGTQNSFSVNIFIMGSNQSMCWELRYKNNCSFQYLTFSITAYLFIQSISFFKNSRVKASLEPGEGCRLYSHAAIGGMLIRMHSVLPWVSNPNLVPASHTRLNSTYLPLLIACHCLSGSPNGSCELFDIK